MDTQNSRIVKTSKDQSFRYVPRSLLLILRFHLGVILIITVMGKILRTDPFSVEMLGYIQGFSIKRASAPYSYFLQHVVIPHATLFSYLVIAAELFAGLSLLLGLGTRVAAAIAMFLFLNYLFSKGRLFWSPDSEDAAVFLTRHRDDILCRQGRKLYPFLSRSKRYNCGQRAEINENGRTRAVVIMAPQVGLELATRRLT